MKKFAVIGNPIAHSKSPEIHQAFANQFGLTLSYERVLAPLDDFSGTVKTLLASGFSGANVTVPFKFEAYALAEPTQRARFAGAVNTMVFTEDARVKGDNTDGAGMVHDIQNNLGFPIKNKKVLLLGAGGAAEGVLLPLLSESPARLTIANRTLPKATAMVDKVQTVHGDTLISATSFADLSRQQFDLIVNATSAGLSDDVLPLPQGLFADHALAYDMMYGKETSFIQLAKTAGVQVADGLGMLVEQAAEAFYIWHGVRPNTKSVIASFR